jgi:hypothetical protein
MPIMMESAIPVARRIVGINARVDQIKNVILRLVSTTKMERNLLDAAIQKTVRRPNN